MDQTELQRAIEAILFAAGESVEISRLAMALETDEKEIREAADALADQLAFDRRGIRILRLENSYQMVSSPQMADFITKALETRKPPKLSASQLETLTIVAYYQPATKAMVEQIRGVDSSYSISGLLNKKLIQEAGRLNVPGRPIQYKTTPNFLKTFGLTSLEELPEMISASYWTGTAIQGDWTLRFEPEMLPHRTVALSQSQEGLRLEQVELTAMSLSLRVGFEHPELGVDGGAYLGTRSMLLQLKNGEQVALAFDQRYQVFQSEDGSLHTILDQSSPGGERYGALYVWILPEAIEPDLVEGLWLGETYLPLREA